MTVPAQANPAVYLCCRAALLEYTQAKRDGDSTARAHERMARTFRLAMPPLIGDRKVRDFIACATHGMLLGLLKPEEATKLLYAAQVGPHRPPHQKSRRERRSRETEKRKKRGFKAEKAGFNPPETSASTR